MRHLNLFYSKEIDSFSPVSDDFDRVVNNDEKGVEHISFKKVDYPSVQASLGLFYQWSLDAMISAGINPDTGINTGFNTRLGAYNVISAAIDNINSVVDSDKKAE